MKLLAFTFIIGLSFSVCLNSANGQTNNDKQQLIERFQQNRRSNLDAAYESAKEFVQRYPDDTSDDAQTIKAWLKAYEKVESDKSNSSSTVNQQASNSSSSANTETAEMAEARIAITKYKDYTSAVKSLESSSESTKRTSLWLQMMITAQEGLGNEEEELKYLEKYNEVIPNQKDTTEKLADLRYKVKKEAEEENKYGTLEDTVKWLKNNSLSNIFINWYPTKYIDSQGTNLIVSNCAAEDIKLYKCRMTTLPLSKIKVNTLALLNRLGDNDIQLYYVQLGNTNDERIFNCEYLEKEKPVGVCEDWEFRTYVMGAYNSKQQAENTLAAMKHAIKLAAQK